MGNDKRGSQIIFDKGKVDKNLHNLPKRQPQTFMELV